MPYPFVFDFYSRADLEYLFEDSILIIDEAHNVPHVCDDSGSIEITEELLLNSIQEIEEIKKRMKYTKGV